MTQGGKPVKVHVNHLLDMLIVLLAVSLLLGGAVRCVGSESVPDGADEALTSEARTFVELFLEGDSGQLHGRMTARMQSGFPPDMAEQIHQDIVKLGQGLVLVTGTTGAG